MPNLLEQGASWLAGKLVGSAGTPVRYVRDGGETELVAVIGRTEFEQTDEYGGIQRIQSRDYLIRAADLVIGGAATLPQAGDRIRETVAAQTFVYEVMAPGQQPPWRYSDPFRQVLRIHTKHVDTEE